MQKDNSLKTAVIVGNHKLENGHIVFDQKAYSQSNTVYIDNADRILLLDTKGPIVSYVNRRRKFLNTQNSIRNIKTKFDADFVIFENSIRQLFKREKAEYCTVLGKNGYRPTNETTVCSCWGLGVILCLKLLEKYQKVIFVTSPDSFQLKVADAIKMQHFFENHDEYKDRFELIWAK